MEALSDFEQLVLRAVASTAPEAYGVSIIDYITNNTGYEPSLAGVYGALERLEAHHMVGSRFVEGGPERAGRSKLLWSMTPVGWRALTPHSNEKSPAAMRPPG